jgi:predicted O-methyltransferase YrrM
MMQQVLYRIIAFTRYFWRAHTKYNVHSPFVFEFTQNVLDDTKWYYTFNDLQRLRNQLLRLSDEIEVTDFGAGSQVLKTRRRRIKDIAASSLSKPYYCQILFSLVHWLKPTNILELGTSLGVSSLYLAKANQQAAVHTIEGCPNIAAIAKRNFEQLAASNLHQHIGNFDEVLVPVLENMKSVDLVLIDGNHQKEATLRYFETALRYANKHTCFIFDDIFWNNDMTEAWRIIQQHPSTRLSIDIFQFGIVFLRSEQQEQEHFTLVAAHYKPWSMGFFA